MIFKRSLFFLLLLKSLFLFSEEVWIDKLQGIVFVKNYEEDTLISGVGDDFCGVKIVDVDVPDKKKFIQNMKCFLGLPLSSDLLKNLKKCIVDHYRKNGFLVVGVLVPANQDITEGVLKVVINIGCLGEIKACGSKYFSNEMLASKLCIKKGDYLKRDNLTSGLNWINQNPFRTSDIILEPGKDYGQTDIVLSTKDRRPVRIFSGYENTGNQIAGSSRFLAGINIGNIFSLDHQLNYLFRFSPHFNQWWGHSLSYIAPLPWRHIFEAYGFFTHSRPDVDVGFDTKGKSWQLAGRYKIPFQIKQFSNTFFIGYEFQRTNNFSTFQESLVFDTYIDVSQFLVALESFVESSCFSATFGLEVYLSPGNMTAFNNDETFSEESEGAKSNYIYGKARYEQTVYLPKKFHWWLDVLFQQASGKLLPTEQFSLGGFYTVRGYDENEVISDNGILIKNELHFPYIRLYPKRKCHQIHLIGFIDYGRGYDVNQNILSQSAATLASIGPGIRYEFENYISARFDYGWQLDTILRRVDPSNKKSRAHFNLIVSY